MTKSEFYFAVPAALICAAAFTSCSEPAPQTRVEIVRRAADALATAQNRATADAAAEKFSALMASLEKFDKTPEAAGADAESAVSALLSQAARLRKENFYGSEALKNALSGQNQAENF